jgi:hypothetical protein
MGYKGTIAKTNFTLGEISPRSLGRFDQDKPIFKNGAAILENFLIGEAGAASFRPGTQYIANVKNQAPALWVTGTSYVVGNNVLYGGNVYICLIAHTSGIFATDLAAGDWELSPVQSGQVRLERFTYNIAQEYVMEMGHQYIRFYANTGQLMVSSAPAWVTSTPYVVGNFVSEGGNIYYCVIAHTSGTFATDLAAGDWIQQVLVEIPTIFNQTDIFNLQTAQKADVMYIVNPNYFPQKLIRTSATSFSIANVNFFRGPFLDVNITATTISASSDTGTTTLTASEAIFQIGHVGSLWRVKNGVVLITGFTSSTVVVGIVQAELNVPAVPNAWGLGQNYNIGDYVSNSGTIYRCLVGNTTSDSSVFATDLSAGYWLATAGSAGDLGTGGSATTDWQEGAFSQVRGYPSSVTFHEGRLVYSGTAYKPQTLYASAVDTYDSFDVGTAQNADAWTYEIANQQSNGIRWLESDTALQIGTSGGSVTAADGNASTGITPSSPPTISYNDVYGAMVEQPVKLGGYSFFLQANKFYLRQLTYDLITSKYKSGSQMVLADHILRDGLGAVQMASQSSPTDRIWIIRADGQIAVLTRDPEQQVTGWCRIVGGESDITQSCVGYSGTFESICIIPLDGQDDQVWVVAKRSINGVLYRYIEIFTAELFQNYWEPVRMDCSYTYDNPITITDIDTTQNPILVTAPNHGLTAYDQVKIDGCIGAAQLNGGIFAVFSPTTNTFRLQGLIAPTITTQPVNALVVAPNTATFTIVATGSVAPTLQWYISTDGGNTWTPINGATSASYTTPATTLANNGNQFKCVATNSVGNVTSNVAILTVDTVPSFTTQPLNITVPVGNTATFTSVAIGNPAPTYQWQISTDSGSTWTNILGATSASYTTPPTTSGQDQYEYRCVATNSAGTTDSSAATMTVDYSPNITTQPSNTSVNEPGTATFTITATGDPLPTYQWYLSTNGGTSFTPISGATSAAYTTGATNVGMNGYQYKCVATNSQGSATSNVAILTVNVPALEVLIVAGGGGGGNDSGGGGGAGGLLYQAAVNFILGNSYTITVGTGGAGATTAGARGASGVNSTAFGYTSVGGGGGGGSGTSTGLNGGSGGGGAFEGPGPGGTGTSGQGYAGGYGYTQSGPTTVDGAGGGGAGGVGVTATANHAGAGGAGISNSITGSAVIYAAGGGGGDYAGYGGTAGAGGSSGVGGAGNNNSAGGATGAGGVGATNTGSGGGGGSGAHGYGGNGAAGVVIIAYTTGVFGADGTGGTVTHSGGMTIHTFTTSGTFVAPTGS